jgi:ferredoxin--NADP+ reductase
MNLEVKKDCHYIAIIGGSIAGSEAAILLAQKGFKIVVFDMNKLPYGKVEDGLPNWHINLRNRQIKEIDAKLDHPNVIYVPLTKIGDKISFMDLYENWEFSAIILANGSWADRKLGVKSIEKFKDRELIYQNSLINWFNHKHETDFSGQNYFLKGKVVVIGGGLASLDVIKIAMIELVRKQLYIVKNIKVDRFLLEKNGVKEVLDKNKITLEDLNVQKAVLVYRRSAKDMPLKIPKDKSDKSVLEAKLVSEKLLLKYADKYMFEFIPNSVLVDYEEEDDKLKKLYFQKIKIINGLMQPEKNKIFKINLNFVISSIGSIPEEIEGVEYENSLLKLEELSTYKVEGLNNVFAIGNAVTGKGNILESKKQGKKMTSLIVENHLSYDGLEKWLDNYNNKVRSETIEIGNSIAEEIKNSPIVLNSKSQSIIKNVEKIHKKLGYSTYKNWIYSHLPVRLEDILKNKTDCKCE